MAIPLACGVMRAVFDQAPLGEREAAMALGGTRFGVVRTVVLPFAKGGIIGGTMLALGRALGETAAVLIILTPAYEVSARILQSGAQTTSALIASDFGNATAGQLKALLTAGFVLFLITLVVNTGAAVIIRRSRSGATTEI
jgi:phosphate transport system permease protein